MQKSFITRVNGWRFERPLAAALAASAIFMVMAVPPEQLSVFPALTAFPGLQIVLAVIAGLLLGVLGYAAMIYPWPQRVGRRAVSAEPAIPEEDGHFAAAEVSLRLRRADRHPDAPVREPIFASRDLGSPFMEVGAFAPPPADEAVDAPAASLPIPDGEFAEVDPVSAEAGAHVDDPAGDPQTDAHEPAEVVADAVAVEPEPVAIAPIVIEDAPAEPVAAPEAEAAPAEIPAPIAAFAPEEEPVPAPSRSQRQSIAAMMDRLSAGLERRAASGEGLPLPQRREPALRDALEELNRLAARRG